MGSLWRISLQFLLDLLDTRQAGLQFRQQRFHQLVLRHADGLRFVAQRLLCHHLILTLEQYQPNGGRIVLVFQLGVHGRQVETSRLELACIYFD